MKSLIITLLATFSVSTALADWVRVFESDSHTLYVDTGTIKNIGNIRIFLQRDELKTKDDYPIKSMQGLWEYDCAKAQFRGRSISIYSGSFASGNIIFSSPEVDTAPWKDVPIGFGADVVRNFVCQYGLTYSQRVAQRIKPNIVFIEDIEGNPAAEVEVTPANDGKVIGVRLLKSSGNKVWDEAVLKAVIRTKSLPLDTNGTIPQFLIIRFKPKD